MYCFNCGNKLSDNAKFCSGCGTKVEKNESVEEVKEEIVEEVEENVEPVEEVKEEVVEEVEEKVEPVEEVKEEVVEEVEEKVEPVEEVKEEVVEEVIEKPEPVQVDVQPVQPVVTKKTMSKTNKVLITLIILVLAVCASFVFIAKIRKGNGRVVMIYMVGSNLESKSGLATNDLSGLDYDKITNNNTKVVLIAGGTTSWQNSYIDVNESSIYELKKTGFQKVNARGRFNMGALDNLSYFLNYVYKSYKADKYDFIFWNHGGAVDGSEYDDFTSDNLKVNEMYKAFADSPFKGDNKLDVISFRTCLNATVEIANAYKEYANYLVASEEVTLGSRFDSALRFINDIKPSDSPVEFGKKQINTYKEMLTATCNEAYRTQKDEYYCVSSTYSITDLSKIDKVNSSLDSFANDLNSKLGSNYNAFAKLRANMSQYGQDTVTFDMIDLYDFTEKYDKYSTHGQSVRNAIKDAVVYNWNNNNYSNGLSIYFPYNDKQFLNAYPAISISDNYTKLITEFSSMKSSNRRATYTNFSTNDGNVLSNKVKETDVVLELTDEQINNMTKAAYLVFVDTKDGYYQVVYSGKDVKVEGNKLRASVKNRLLRITDSEYDDDSMWLLSIEDKVTDQYVELKAFLYLSNTTDLMFGRVEPSTAIIRIDDEHPNGYIKMIYNNLSSEQSDGFSTFAPTATKLTDYNFVTVMSSRYKLLDENGNYNPDWTSTSNNVLEGTINRTNMVKLAQENFDNGYDYYVVFRVFDIYNNEFDSKPIKISK